MECRGGATRARSIAGVFEAALACVLAVLAAACGPGAGPQARRAYAPDLSLRSPAPIADSALASPLLIESHSSACERLAALRSEAPLARTFSFLGGAGVGRGGEPWMAIDVASSPYAHVALGEDFRLDSLEEFWTKAQEARARGEISGAQWAVLLAARQAWEWTGIEWPLRELQLRATNAKVAEAFPGVFGEPGPPNKAFASGLVRKLGPSENLLLDRDALPAFLARTNLFVDGSWTSFAEDVLRSLGAAVRSYALDPARPANQRACSFALLQRSFAQLIALKGFVGLRTERVAGRPWSRTAPIDSARLGFEKRAQPGAFIEAKTGTRIVLAADRIASYDPTIDPVGTGRLRLAPRLPMSDGSDLSTASDEPAKVDDELAFLRAMALAFEGTSPAAPWVPSLDLYMLGDVRSTQNRAVLPDQMHALAAGLFVVAMKNLAVERLIPVAAGGRAARSGEDPSGVVLAAGKPGQRTIRLGDTVALIEAIVSMDQALLAFARPDISRETWTRLLPFYQPQTQMSLFGPILFSDAELRASLPGQASEATLKHGLDRLKLPLAALALKLLDAGVAEMEWDPDRGFGRPLARPRPEFLSRAKFALARLAANARSPALAERARKL